MAKLLFLNFESDFTDESSFAHTVAPDVAGDVVINTSVVKSGVGSGHFLTGEPGPFLNVTQAGSPDTFDFATDKKIECYIRYDSFPNTTNIAIFRRGGTFPGSTKTIFVATSIENTSGIIRLQVYLHTGISSEILTTSNITVNTDQWYHFGLLWDQSENEFKVYWDRVLVGTFNPTLSVPTFSHVDTATIGYSGSVNFDGYIDRYLIESDITDPFHNPTDFDGSSLCPYVEDGQVRKMVDTVSGLTHLEGEAIKVQMDSDIPRNSAGNEVTNSFTVSSGSITLPKKAAVVHAGLGYDGTIKFLKPNQGSQLGTGQTKKRRMFLAILRLYRALGLSVGLDEDNLDEIFDSDQTTLYTGDQEKLPNTTWDKETQMVIKQTKPLPAYILAAIFRSETEERL